MTLKLMKGHSCEKYKGKERYWAQSAAFSWLFVRILYRMAIFMEKIILSGFSDEIAPGFDQQLAAVKEFGLGYIELRAADGINVSDFTPEKLREVKGKLAEAGIAAEEFTVENGEYFCIGDNPGNSEDSRSANIGPVLEEDIIGKVWFRAAYGDTGMGFVK